MPLYLNHSPSLLPALCARSRSSSSSAAAAAAAPAPALISVLPPVKHHHPVVALRSSPSKIFLAHERKHRLSGLGCAAASDHPPVPEPNTIQKKILDFCFRFDLEYKGLGECFCNEILTAVGYCMYTLFSSWTLGVFPYPCLLSAFYLAAGILVIAAGWLIGIYVPLETDLEFWKSLLPVAVAHTIGHVAVMLSLSKSSASFIEIMRCGEPVFAVLLWSWFIERGNWVPVTVQMYLSLLPIIGGCALVAATERNFNIIGFIAVMIANCAFTIRNILSERARWKRRADKSFGKQAKGTSYGAYLSILSLLILTPFALTIEGPRLWATGWSKATLRFPAYKLIMVLAIQSLVHGLYVQDMYWSYPHVHIFPFFTVNTMKKMLTVALAITLLNPVQPINALGAAIVIVGVVIHSRELCKLYRTESWFF